MAQVNMTLVDIHDPIYDPALDRKNLFKFLPNEICAGLFLASFGILTIIHIVLTINSRIWWLFCTALGGLGECVGWYGRLWGSQNPRALNSYLIQQVCLAISPVFFSGVCYGLFTKLVFIIDPTLSRIKPKWYTPIFVTCDVITLTIQAIGGGQSAAATRATDSGAGERAKRGGHIYLAGVSAQLALMIVFSVVGLDFMRRVRKSNIPEHVWKSAGGKRVKILVWGIILASGLIIFRNTFRTVELAQGFHGYLAVHEIYFAILDAAPMALCMMALALTHPAFTLSMVTPATFSRIASYRFPNDSASDRKVRAYTLNNTASNSEKGLEMSNSRQWTPFQGSEDRIDMRDHQDHEQSYGEREEYRKGRDRRDNEWDARY